MKQQVRTRFAPSPTGYLHVGGARTALFNYLYARAQGGTFIIRVEDTDQERSTPESEKLILESLDWLGIHAEEGPEQGGPVGPYRQSERLEIYQRYTDTLIREKMAYPCFCTDQELEAKQGAAKFKGVPHIYDGKCRGLSEKEVNEKKKAGQKFAIRFRVNPGEVVVDDMVQGRVKFDARLIGDFIIVKSDGFPSYNYAVVVDDYEMKISHVIRGVGHLSNTPRQILIHQALKLPTPAYAHLSEIVGMDRKKLSKRKGATSVLFFRDLGYLSEAFTNYMALLGWYPEDAAEFMPDGGLEKKFDLARCSKSPAMFDFFLTDKSQEAAEESESFNPAAFSPEELKKFVNNKSKLNWLNNKYIRHLPIERAWEEAVPFLQKNPLIGAEIKKDAERTKHVFNTLRVYLDTLRDAIPYMLELLKTT
ncbi:MAG: glutamate--tRNA ligase, partial [Spirochaetia bacterium]|nr:glutamate--tRNA ligase [Spirochaetia bacterium]